mmetsp:Transcript_14244/g.33164  ORF Transcript_14244/g.33164 Transcript_14244/m.33164 type:complete len:133 (-) Transcript_14244:1025-1423(-)
MKESNGESECKILQGSVSYILAVLIYLLTRSNYIEPDKKDEIVITVSYIIKGIRRSIKSLTDALKKIHFVVTLIFTHTLFRPLKTPFPPVKNITIENKPTVITNATNPSACRQPKRTNFPPYTRNSHDFLKK